MTDAARPQIRPIVGMSAMMANTLLVPLLGVPIKILDARSYSTIELLLYRSLIMVMIIVPALVLASNREALRMADLRAHAVHVFFTLTSVGCLFYALGELPLVTVTTISFATPIIGLLLARVFLGERLSPMGWGAVAIGFAGTLVVLRPGADEFHPASLIALMGAFLAACMNISLRRMPARSNNFAVVFYLAMAGALVFGTLGLPQAEMPTLTEWGWLLFLAVATIAIYLCTALAFRLARSMLVGALSYLRIIWATLIGVAIFGETPHHHEVLGFALILGSGLLIISRGARNAVPALAPATSGR